LLFKLFYLSQKSRLEPQSWCFQFLGGAVFLAIAQSVFASNMKSEIATLAPDLDPQVVVQAGAGAFRQVLTPSQVDAVLQAYNVGITATFVSTQHVLSDCAELSQWIPTGGAIIAFLIGWGMEWKIVKGMSLGPPAWPSDLPLFDHIETKSYQKIRPEKIWPSQMKLETAHKIKLTLGCTV